MLRAANPPVSRSANHILAGLAADDAHFIRTHLKSVELPRGTVLSLTGDPIRQVLFPYSGAVSIMVALAAGHSIEAGVVGHNGAVGAAAALVDTPSLNDAIVRLPTRGVMVPAPILRKCADQSSVLRSSLVRWERMLLAQAQQTAACNAVHPLEQRVSRWLLHLRDLIQDDVLPLTHEYLAQMVGGRRTTLTLIAQHLQIQGMIEYRRGIIRVRDAHRLRQLACECYDTLNQYFELFIEWRPTSMMLQQS
jgi:CRP-like cAMP-binding protein